MQCVILAAGKGVRMQPLTHNTPKPLISVLGKPLIEHITEALPSSIESIVVITGYLGDQIQERYPDTLSGRPITYIDQKQPTGTGDALCLAKGILSDTFLVMLGDDIHGKDALERAVQHKHCLVAATSKYPERFGVIEMTEENILTKIVEKPAHPTSNLVSTGAMVLTQDIFNHTKPHTSDIEYGIPDMLESYSPRHAVYVEIQDTWIPVGYPEDVARAESILARQNQVK